MSTIGQQPLLTRYIVDLNFSQRKLISIDVSESRDRHFGIQKARRDSLDFMQSKSSTQKLRQPVLPVGIHLLIGEEALIQQLGDALLIHLHSNEYKLLTVITKLREEAVMNQAVGRGESQSKTDTVRFMSLQLE